MAEHIKSPARKQPIQADKTPISRLCAMLLNDRLQRIARAGRRKECGR